MDEIVVELEGKESNVISRNGHDTAGVGFRVAVYLI